ncbi:filamin-B-like [Centruroides sculpturatus]|uniref:filamin-B-like n=1 Tax=Centruroides sculpturatus TaxID=218467 RepID=UPI000C6E444E|nr:filamin-B-like [Centruroides sculpturatus]
MAHFKINYLEKNIDIKRIRAEIHSPSGKTECHLNLNKSGGTGTFMATEVGIHELIVYCEEEMISCCPLKICVQPDISKILFSGIDPCALGSIVEVLINSNGAGGGKIDVEAIAPSGKNKHCPIGVNDGAYTATFTPDEIGEWKIFVTYSGEHIQGSPFTCFVYDPLQVKVSGFEKGSSDKEVTFKCDASNAGWGKVKVNIKKEGLSIPHEVDERGNGIYHISFTPVYSGKYEIHILFNNLEVKGSPFILRISDNLTILNREIEGNQTDFETKKNLHHSVMSSGLENFSSFNKENHFVSSLQHKVDHINTMSDASNIRSSHSISSKLSLRNVDNDDDLSFQQRAEIVNSSLSFNNQMPKSSKFITSYWEEEKNNEQYDSKNLSKSSKSLSSSSLEQIDHEELSFHQRAELVNNKLMARKEETRSFKPPPPTPKKPVSVDVTTQSSSLREQGSRFQSTTNEKFENLHHDHTELTKNKVKENYYQKNLSRTQGEFGTKQKSRQRFSGEEFANLPYNPSHIDSMSTNVKQDSHIMHQFRTVDNNQSTESLLHKETLNTNQVVISGDGLRMVPVKQPSVFTISRPNLKLDDINVIVTAPSGREIPIRLDMLSHGEYQVEYITPEVGEHVIDVLINGRPLSGSPYCCYGYDASKIKVGNIPNGVVGKAVEFEIDGADAGSGNLEILVNGGHVTSNVKSLGNHRFLASFIPHTSTMHAIEMKFNGQRVPGSPWKCEVVDLTKRVSGISVKGEALKTFSTDSTASFEINTSGYCKEDIRINITSPSQNNVQYHLIDLANDNYRVDFNAYEVGTYTIDVKVAGQRVSGSPFLAKAYNASQIQVTEVPRICFMGEMCQFNVDASLAGEGQLEISINDGNVPNQVQVLGNGRCLVSFRPEAPIPHIIDIKFNDKNVPGCPIEIEVSDTNSISVDLHKLELIPVNHAARFIINTKGAQESNFKVTVTSPSNAVLPVKMWENIRNGYFVEFIPKEVGQHTILVEYLGNRVNGTPLTIKVYDAKRVEVSGMPEGLLGKTVQFTVDASQAGEGNLEITVSAKGRNIPTQVHPLGSAKFGVSFVPTDLHEHIISISFNKESVPGSPFTVHIIEAGIISAAGAGLIATSINKTAIFMIQNVAGLEQDINVKIEGPDEKPVPYSMKEASNGYLKVEYVPNQTGEYKVCINYRGMPIVNSPFISKVYDIKQIKVKDMPKGFIGKPVSFIVETANAGPGNLEVMVNSGQVPTVPQAQGSGLYAITFVPKDIKRHIIDLKFNGEIVPGSPFECQIVDYTKIKIKGEGIERVPIQQPTSFVIDTHGTDMGDFQVTILGPNQKQLQEYINGNYHSGYRVEYTPVEVGDHSIDVRLHGHPIMGSPFLVKAYDASRVKVTDIGSGIVGKPVYFSIDACQAGAGNLEIIVSVNGRNVPNYVQSEGNAKFRVNFKPTEPQMHMLSVKFNGEPVPGSPYYVKVTDSSQSVITGSSLRMTSLSRGAHFTVDTRGAENAECKVIVTGPSGKKIPVTLTKTSITTFEVQFNPIDVGPHTVAVMLDGSHSPGSPFTCNVYDVSKVKVSKLSQGIIGKQCTFQVDASHAGEGTLELVVTTRKSSVRAEVSMKSRGLYDVTFVPQEKMSHYINITFNEEDVPGSPFKIDIRDSSNGTLSSSSKMTKTSVTINGEGLRQGLVGSVNSFEIDTNGLEGDINVKVLGPMGIPVPVTLVKTDQTTHHVEYNCREVGMYKIEVLHSGSPIFGKPFLVEVCDPSRVKVMDIEDGVIGREQMFKVDTSRAGRGNLMVSIMAGNHEVKHSLQELNSGVYQVLYTPKSDVPHKINVYYNGHQAPGCPQIVDIRDPGHSIIAHGIGLKSVAYGESASFLVETGGYGEAKDFDILVSGPNGSPLPVKCYQQKDGSLLVEWAPQHTGSHKIEIFYCGKSISGSPYICQVFDANSVTMQKVKTTTFSVHEKISFTLNRKDAGFAELDVTVTSPLGRHLPIEVKGTADGEGELIEFTPTVPGKYKIAITYGGIEVPGSPITFIAQEEGNPKIEGAGLTVAQCGIPASFKLNGKGLWGRPEVHIDGPQSEVDCEIEEEEEGIYIVTYIPQEVGVFDIRILWNGREVAGSPFHPRIVNPQKVRIIGGWESLMDEQHRIALTIGEEKRIPFDVGDAGPGKLKTEIRSPTGIIDSHVEQIGSHRYHLCFTPLEEGEYYIYIYYSDLPLPKSPFLAFAGESGLTLDHTRVVLRGHGLTGARVADEAEFIIDGSEAGPGSPEVSLSGVKADIPIRLTSLGNNVYKAFYTPSIPGAYLLNVMWSERQVKGCPLKVTVVANCDASKVGCSGEGLRGGTVGKEIKAFIDTRRAGPGELTAHCMGPHKVAYCELYDHRDGTFTLYLKPQEGGRHILTVKYGGEHVSGSPFTLRIAGAPDASKVRVYGPGIEPGVLAIYQSRFICDTRGAGAGQLTVRIRGPKGAFRVEMQRESQKDRTILCKYDPTEPGDYRIEVKWSGEHVPGSPFMVMIFDTQEELNHYLQGQYHSPPSNSGALPPSDYFGSGLTYGTSFGQMSWRGSTAEL